MQQSENSQNQHLKSSKPKTDNCQNVNKPVVFLTKANSSENEILTNTILSDMEIRINANLSEHVTAARAAPSMGVSASVGKCAHATKALPEANRGHTYLRPDWHEFAWCTVGLAAPAYATEV